jgi:hypothetical protein
MEVGGVVKGDIVLEKLPKLDAATRIAKRVIEEDGRSVCIFADNVKALEAIGRALTACGIPVVMIHGDSSDATPRQFPTYCMVLVVSIAPLKPTRAMTRCCRDDVTLVVLTGAP